MVITVFGATGQVGSSIVRQALANNHHVKAFGRNIEKWIDEDLRNDHFEVMKGYVFDEKEVFNAVKGSDAVLSALGGSMDGTDKARSLGMKNIIKQMEKAGVKRLIGLGGMGVLNADEDTYLLDTPTYPEEYLAVGREHLQAFLFAKASSLDWTFVCPPDILDKDATGHYITQADYPPDPNIFKIAAGDIADFMLNELTKNEYIHHRVGISAT